MQECSSTFAFYQYYLQKINQNQLVEVEPIIDYLCDNLKHYFDQSFIFVPETPEQKQATIKLNDLFLTHLALCGQNIVRETYQIFFIKSKEILCLYELIEQILERKSLNLDNLLLCNQLELILKEKQYYEDLERYKFVACLYLISYRYLRNVSFILEYNQNNCQKLFETYRKDSLCLRYDLSLDYRIYYQQIEFTKYAFENNMSILSGIVNFSSKLYLQQVPFYSIFQNKQCILTSSFIDRKLVPNIIIPNIKSIVNVHNFIQGGTKQSIIHSLNNLQLSKILKKGNSLNNLTNKLCLTIIPNKIHISKIQQFLLPLPTEIRPNSATDIFAYQKVKIMPQFTYKIATPGYWQYQDYAEYTQVFYNCSDLLIQWIVINKINHNPGKGLKDWVESQLFKLGNGSVRGIQKKGDIVVIPPGNIIYWKVDQKIETKTEIKVAILLCWCLFIKEINMMSKFINLSEERAQKSNYSNERIDIAHRTLLLDFVSHEHSRIYDLNTLGLIHNFIKTRIEKEQELLWTIALRYRSCCYIRKLIPKNIFRYCGLCLQEIINYFSVRNNNLLCLQCLNEKLSIQSKNIKQEQFSNFDICFIASSKIINDLFQKIYKFKKSSVSLPIKNIFPLQVSVNALYEQKFCQGMFLGGYDPTYCSGQQKAYDIFPNHIMSFQQLEKIQLSYINSKTTGFSLEQTLKYFCFIDFKRLEYEKVQILLILKILAQLVPNQKELCREISLNYEQYNLVIQAMSFLSN